MQILTLAGLHLTASRDKTCFHISDKHNGYSYRNAWIAIGNHPYDALNIPEYPSAKNFQNHMISQYIPIENHPEYK